MGRRGPPPKPAKVKKAQGTYRKDRDAQAGAVELQPGAPPMPARMPKIAQRRWAEVAPELLRVGTLAVVDGGALEAYCRTFARWSALEAAAERQRTVKTPYGPKVNPAGDAARKLHKEVIQPLELALGLHYAARNRVKMPDKPDEQDPVEKDIFGPLKAVPGGKTT